MIVGRRAIHVLVAAGLFCLVSACSSQNRGKIEGTKWTNLAADVHNNPVPRDLIQIEFFPDGKLRYVIDQKEHGGSYSFGTRHYVFFRLDPPVEMISGYWEEVLLADRRLTLKDASGTALVFERLE